MSLPSKDIQEILTAEAAPNGSRCRLPRYSSRIPPAQTAIVLVCAELGSRHHRGILFGPYAELRGLWRLSNVLTREPS